MRYISNLDVPAASFERWSKPEQAAFWLNAYNAIVLRTVINAYPIKGTSSQYPVQQHPARRRRVRREAHRIGGRSTVARRTSRSRCCPTFDDPRMYFALGRGSLGGGRLRSEAFTAPRLEQQLVGGGCRMRRSATSASATTPPRIASRSRRSSDGARPSSRRPWPGRSRRPSPSAARSSSPSCRWCCRTCCRARGAVSRRNTFSVAYSELRLAPQRSHRRRTSLTWISDWQERSPSSPAAARGSAWRRRSALVAEGARVAICGRTPATLAQAARGTRRARRAARRRARRDGRRLAARRICGGSSTRRSRASVAWTCSSTTSASARAAA